MDHNLDTLNLESAMGVDFGSADHADVSQAHLALSSSNHEGIPMEFEQIEEQPMHMETGSEEIIDFMGDACGEFTLQEYSVQDDQTTGLTTIAESNQNVLTSQAETMFDLQLQPQTPMTAGGHKIISVKAAIPARAPTTAKIATAAAPRQVAIAPKPPRLTTKTFGQPFGNKQFAIAPKPVSLVKKKVSIGNVVQTNTKGNTVLAQIGKQIVVMPAGTQKLKLVAPTTSSVQYIRANSDQSSLISTKDQPRPVMMTKVIVQGQHNMDMNQPAVITKILPTSTAPTAQARFVALPQKSVPIAIGNKVFAASPTKQGVKLGKKQQIIAIKSPNSKLLPAPALGNTSKKMVLSTNPTQNVILKTTAPPKTAQIGKDGNVIIEGQHTQLHQINVPGKGIQYIRLVTHNSAQATKSQAAGSLLSVPSKFVLSDNKVGGKKLVRIAPVMPKTSLSQSTRSSQSLLAPLSPVAADSLPVQDINDLLAVKQEVDPGEAARARTESEQVDSKAALQSLIENTIGQDAHDMQLSMSEVEIDYKRPPPAISRRRMPKKSPMVGERRSYMHETRDPQHPLIVIRSGYGMENDTILPDQPSNDRMDEDEEETRRSILNMEADMMNSNDSPPTPNTASEAEMSTTELGLRPRKACNCTKSQCLKLYCDCFANGEFCNRCNCNNCHNNLENEELRQKAIRGCLERNPNAFRPKIGKAKSGGPEIVRRHNKGCNCKRSGCLKNYCECYEAKIACTAICKCVGCRNVEESLERFRRQELTARPVLRPCVPNAFRNAMPTQIKQPCSFMTSEVIEAVCQCLVAAAGEPERGEDRDPMRDVIDEFARCLQDIIGAAHHAAPAPTLLDQGTT